jgi:NAD(P)-dependent dehydrogenase (short-subunit alcohol dehydrogenase family)
VKASAPSRIVVVSSTLHLFGKIDVNKLNAGLSKGDSVYKVYGNTKLANVLFTNELARRLDGTGNTNLKFTNFINI